MLTILIIYYLLIVILQMLGNFGFLYSDCCNFMLQCYSDMFTFYIVLNFAYCIRHFMIVTFFSPFYTHDTDRNAVSC